MSGLKNEGACKRHAPGKKISSQHGLSGNEIFVPHIVFYENNELYMVHQRLFPTALFLCAAYGGTDHLWEGDEKGQGTSGVLLSLLSGACCKKRAEKCGFLLYFHRGVPFPEPGGGKDRGGDCEGISAERQPDRARDL